MSLAAGAIPFGIPAEHLLGVSLGTIQRYGSILKDAQTGRIVGHLQETGLLGRALDLGFSLDPTGVTGIIGVAQNAQINRKVTALQAAVGNLQSLQLVALASSVVGIGVTAASTAMIMNRLGKVGDNIERIGESVERLPVKFMELDLRKTLVDTRTSLERLGGAGRRQDGEDVVKSAEERLHRGFNQILGGLETVLHEREVNPALVQSLLAGASLCSGARIKAFFWLNELESAAVESRSHYLKLERLARMIPADVLAHRLPGGAEQAAHLLGELSEIRLRTASLPGLSSRLIELDVNGRDYLDRIESEEEYPLLVIPGTA